MFGIKINEFDDSDGSIDSFNSIFPNTPLDQKGYVEILNISEGYNDVYVRDISINGKIVAYDFGKNNFSNPEFSMEERVRFKYFAKDLSGNILASAFNIKDLANKMKCGECLIKNRLSKPILSGDVDKNLFNVERIEL